jgi:hypothetical protein
VALSSANPSVPEDSTKYSIPLGKNSRSIPSPSSFSQPSRKFPARVRNTLGRVGNSLSRDCRNETRFSSDFLFSAAPFPESHPSLYVLNSLTRSTPFLPKCLKSGSTQLLTETACGAGFAGFGVFSSTMENQARHIPLCRCPSFSRHESRQARPRARARNRPLRAEAGGFRAGLA